MIFIFESLLLSVPCVHFYRLASSFFDFSSPFEALFFKLSLISTHLVDYFFFLSHF
jgi:hypothetical protein